MLGQQLSSLRESPGKETFSSEASSFSLITQIGRIGLSSQPGHPMPSAATVQSLDLWFFVLVRLWDCSALNTEDVSWPLSS